MGLKKSRKKNPSLEKWLDVVENHSSLATKYWDEGASENDL